MQNFKFCNGMHSHLICPKPPSIQAFMTGEEDEPGNELDDDDGYAIIEQELAQLMEAADIHMVHGENEKTQDEEDSDGEDETCY